MKMLRSVAAFGLLVSSLAIASTEGVETALPKPPEGYRWVKNEAFSDEFNGNELDATKWHDHNPRWIGRPPGKFMPSSVTVGEGCLQIRCTPLAPPTEDFNVACGAVQSKSRGALYGYYECRMKASSLTTSSTFWLSSSEPKPSPYGNLSLELDIHESIGNAQRWPSFKTHMHSNTHIKLSPNERGEELIRQLAKDQPLPEKKQQQLASMNKAERAEALAAIEEGRRVLKRGNQARLCSAVDEAFHTYACWWVDANTMHFYADGELVYTIEPKTDFDPTPFNHPLHMNLVCETYSWEVEPTIEELNNDAINTTRYDYVRSFKLVELPR